MINYISESLDTTTRCVKLYLEYNMKYVKFLNWRSQKPGVVDKIDNFNENVIHLNAVYDDSN